jgi:hypothetical protein
MRGRRPRHRDADDRRRGNAQPAEVPFNLYGMANGAIPKFRIRVA